MAQGKLELAVSTGAWDAGLRKAQQTLQSFIQNQNGLHEALAKNGDKMASFIQLLGRQDSMAKTARGAMSDYRSSIEQLTLIYQQMDETQRQSLAGQATLQAIDRLKQKFAEARAEVERLNADIGQTGSRTQQMGSGGSLLQGLGGRAALGQVAGAAGLGQLGAVATAAGPAAAALAGVTAAVGALSSAIVNNIETARGFELSMSRLSSLTGKTGADLEQLKEYAIELGGSTTQTASEVAQAFSLIGSQMPQLLSSGEAMRDTTKAVITLSEAAGIDLNTAAQTVATSVNQFGGDASRASEMVNILAAASQAGAGGIGWLGEAITKSGTTAKAVGTDYNELVANLEQLAAAGYDASTAGTALRSIVMSLEKQATDQYKPSVVGLTQAFANLRDAHLSLTDMQGIAGKMFAAQAMALAENSGKAAEMTDRITGTNLATSQAATNAQNLDGALKSLSSAWEALNLHINSSNGPLTKMVNGLTDVIRTVDRLLPKIKTLGESMAATGLNQLVPGLGTAIRIAGGNSGQKPDAVQQSADNRVENLRRKPMMERQTAYDAAVSRLGTLRDRAQAQADAISWDAPAAEREKKRRLLATAGNYGRELETYQQRVQKEGLLDGVTVNGKSGGSSQTMVTVDADTEPARKTIKQLRSEIKSLTKLRDEAADAGDTEGVADYNSQIRQKRTEIKAMQGTGGSTSSNPAAQAEQTVANALKNYEATISKNAAMEAAGSSDALQAKKDELQAHSRLLDAYAQADATYSKPEYKEAMAKEAQAVVGLTAEVEGLQQQAKAAKEHAAKMEQLPKAERAVTTVTTRTAEAQGLAQRVTDAGATVGGSQDIVGGWTVMKIVADTNEAWQQVRQFTDDIEGRTVEFEVKPKVDKTAATQENLSSYLKTLKQQMGSTEVGGKDFSKIQGQMADAQSLQTMMQAYQGAGLSMEGTGMAGAMKSVLVGVDIDETQLEGLLTELNEKLQAAGLEPIEINFKTGAKGLDNVKKEAKDTQAQFMATMQATAQLGSALQTLDDPGLKVAGIIANAVANVAMGFAQASASSGKLGVVGWIAATVAGLATMVSTISAIKSATHYAGGGIVGGNDYTDNTPIFVSSGELILNQAQQGAVAAGLAGQAGMQNAHLETTLRGEDIRIALRHGNQRRGYGSEVLRL